MSDPNGDRTESPSQESPTRAPEKLSNYLKKKLEKQERAKKALERFHERVTSGAPPIYKKQQPQQSLMGATRPTRRKVEESTATASKSASFVTQTIKSCEIQEAYSTYRIYLPVIWNQALKESAHPSIQPNPISVCEDDVRGFQVVMPNVVTNIKDQLNANPFQRTDQDRKNVVVHNTAWRNWMIHHCATAIEKFCSESSVDGESGQITYLNLKDGVDEITGVMQKLSLQLEQENIGPVIPGFSKRTPTETRITNEKTTANDLSQFDNQEFRNDHVPSKMRKLKPIKPDAADVHSRRILTLTDFPFRMLVGKPSSHTFGDYKSDVLLNQDMLSLVPGEQIYSTVFDVALSIISDKSMTAQSGTASGGRKYVYVSQLEFDNSTNSANISLRDTFFERIRTRILSKPTVNLVAIAVHVQLTSDIHHYVVAIADTISHNIQIYDPLYNGGFIVPDGSNRDLCLKLRKIGSLLANIKGEDVALWTPVGRQWPRYQAPTSLGVQQGNEDCCIYCLLFLEIFGNTLDVMDPVNSHVWENGVKYHWDIARRRYFLLIKETLAKNGSLNSQPYMGEDDGLFNENEDKTLQLLDTPVTSLAKGFASGVKVIDDPTQTFDQTPFQQEKLFGDDEAIDISPDNTTDIINPSNVFPHVAAQSPKSIPTGSETSENSTSSLASSSTTSSPSSSATSSHTATPSPTNQKGTPIQREKSQSINSNQKLKLESTDSSGEITTTTFTINDSEKVVTPPVPHSFISSSGLQPNPAAVTMGEIRGMTSKERDYSFGKIHNTNCQIAFSDLFSLKTDGILTPNIITAIGESIKKRGRVMHPTIKTKSFTLIAPSEVSKLVQGKLIQKSVTNRPRSLYSQIMEVYKTGRLMLPFNLNSCHWVLFIFEVETGVISVFDPQKKKNTGISPEIWQVLKVLVKSIQQILMNGDIGMKTSTSSPVTAAKLYIGDKSIPQQFLDSSTELDSKSDTVNSGIFVLSYMEFYTQSMDYDALNITGLGKPDETIRRNSSIALRKRYYFQVFDVLIKK